MVKDVHLVGSGLMTPLDFVTKYGFEAVTGFLTSKAGIQLANKLKGPIKRIAEKVSEKFKRGATEAVEEGFEYADDYAEGQASGWYCERCPSAPKSGVKFRIGEPVKQIDRYDWAMMSNEQRISHVVKNMALICGAKK